MDSGNSHENSGPVVMEMASARTKVSHDFFGFTCLAEGRQEQVLQ